MMKYPLQLVMFGTVVTDSALLVCGVLTGPVVARLLLPAGRGALAAVLFWPQLLAGIGLLSLSEAVTYRIGTHPERASLIAASAFWLALILAGATTVVGYVLMPFLLGQERAHLVLLVQMYLLVFIPFNFIALGLLAIDHGKLRFARYNTLRLLVPLIYLLGLVALWATGHVSVAWVIAINCAGTVLVALLRLVLQGHKILTMPSWKEARALLGFALRFHPATVLLLLAGQADQFVALTLWDNTVLGHYVVALTIASSGLAVFSSAFHKVLFPHLAHVRGSSAQVELLAHGVRHATLLMAGLSLPLALLMPWFIPLLFGPAFSDTVGLARVLLVAYLIVALKTIVIQGTRGLGEGGVGTTAAAVSLSAFLLLTWPLANALGLVGIGIALGLANLCALGYLVYYLHRRHNLALRHLWGLDPKTFGEVLDSVSQLNPFLARTTL